MGIKTLKLKHLPHVYLTLKNLPTTWGLRLTSALPFTLAKPDSEKPPHHMGIKTDDMQPIVDVA